MSKKNEKPVEMDKMISVKLPASLLEKARQTTQETGVSLSFIVRKAVEDWTRGHEESKAGTATYDRHLKDNDRVSVAVIPQE